jgi:hypothetical protein
MSGDIGIFQLVCKYDSKSGYEFHKNTLFHEHLLQLLSNLTNQYGWLINNRI